MKIIFDCERMKYPNTGLFEYCGQLGLALLQTAIDDDVIDFYLPKKANGYFGEKVHYINQASLHKFLSPSVKAVDIWHTTYQTSSYMSGRKKGKHILTIHDLNYLYDDLRPERINSYHKKIQRNIDQADYIVAISAFAKSDVEKHLKLKGKPISVIHNGYTMNEFPQFSSPKYNPPQKYLFSLGTVLPKKNFHVLPSLLKNNDYELIIAGVINANYEKQIMSEAKKHGFEKRVKLIGTISSEEKYWYLKNCMAFLFPSLAEGFGIPVIEAMHFGKPVFLSTKTSLPEIGGEHAYYFEHFDPEYMQKVFTEGLIDYEKKIPSSQIIQHAKQFNWIKSAKEYWNVYKQVMDNN